MVLEISNVTASAHGRLNRRVRLRLAPSASSANYPGVSFPAKARGKKKGEIDESQGRRMKRRMAGERERERERI